MTEQLTARAQVAYPVRSPMEDTDENLKPAEGVDTKSAEKKVEEKVDEEKKKIVDATTLKAMQEKARREWEADIKKREAKGEKITDEDKEYIKKLIEQGKPPVSIGGGAGDGRFENIDPDKYNEAPPLKELAQRLKEAGQRGEVPQQFLNEIREEVLTRINLTLINEDQGNEFLEDINKIATQINAQNPRPEQAEEAEGDGFFQDFPAHLFRGSHLENLANQILMHGRSTKRVDEGVVQSWANQARGMRNRGEITEDEYKGFNKELSDIAQSRAASERGEGLGEKLKSIQEVCKWIVDKEGDEYGVGGVSELLDKDGNFNKANFMKWVRERMLHFHNLDPENPQINLLGSIGVETTYRTIGLINMINNKKQYFKDENKRDEKGRNVVYSELADDIINEVYLFNTSRNHDAGYRFQMWSDEELPKFLGGIHQKSDFTKGTQLKTIMTLSENYGEGDTKVGDSIRKAYEVYYHMSDFEKLKEVLGEDSPFFTRRGFENALRLSGEIKGEEIPANYVEHFNKMFDTNGKAKPREFIDYVNLFNETGKLLSTIAVVREAVRQSVSKIYGLDDGLTEPDAHSRNIKRKNLEYAEMWAYSMSRWTGAGARNDTGAIGYDAQTKAMRFQQYRLRQAMSERGGAFGNEYDLPVIKDLTLDFFNGIFVEKEVGGDGKNYTPFEVFQMLDDVDKRRDISEEERNRLKEPIFKKLKFKQYTQLDYASNHLGRAYQVFQSLMGSQELNLDQIVKHEPFRGLVFDRAKFEEQVKEGFIKPIRYAFKTYGNIDYSKTTRVQVNAGKKEVPIYKDVTVAEAMFGPSVLKGFYKKENGKMVIDKELLGKEESRTILYKNVCRAILASHIKAHRERFSGYNFVDKAGIDMFFEALETIRQIEIDDDGTNVEMAKGEGFFSKEDIKWMRKNSGTESWKLAITDVIGRDIAGGAGKGFLEGARDFITGIFK